MTQFRALWQTRGGHILLLLLLWIGAIMVINPIGNFPLNDDWVYARLVHYLVDYGNIAYHQAPRSYALFIAQVFWGALFCLPAGFSFTALRFSTLVLGFVGVLATYLLCEELGIGKKVSLLVSLLVLCNPIYVELSNTFMTDVPFFTMVMLAMLCWVKALKRRSRLWLLAGSLSIVAATFIRQMGLLFALAFAVATLIGEVRGRTLSLRKTTWSLVPLLGLGLAITAYVGYLQPHFHLPIFLDTPKLLTSPTLWGKLMAASNSLFKAAWMSLLYLGLFLSPLMLLVWMRRYLTSTLKVKAIILAILALSLGIILPYLVISHRLLPLGGNIWFDFGLGPVTLKDVYIWGLPDYPDLLPSLWIVLTAIGVAGGAVIVIEVVASCWSMFKRNLHGGMDDQTIWPVTLWLILAQLLFFGSIGLGLWFDRYLLLFIPLLGALIALHSPKVDFAALRKVKITGAVLLTLFGLFAVLATHDYLAWNRARWEALDKLEVEQKVNAYVVDGGYEYNGWYLYDRNYRPRLGVSWWFVQGDDYLASLEPLPGYDPLFSVSYQRYLPWGQGQVYILKRQAVLTYLNL